MQKTLAIIIFGWVIFLGTSVQAADPPQSEPVPAGHQMPMPGGQPPATPPQETDPHSGHAMPGGMGMMGHMHCPMMQGMQHNHAGTPASTGQGGSAVAKAFAKDPICGMDVEMAQAKTAGLTLEYQGKTYYFCSETCKEQFAKNPRP